MSVRPILITGEPVLHTRARPVGDIDDDVRDLVRDMEETMAAAPGVGLAAPQVDRPRALDQPDARG
jgi:peptide deformylase